MAETGQDFELYQQEDVTISITVTGKNLAGATIAWVLARWRHASSAVLTKTTASGITITNPSGGVFQVVLSETDTAAISPGTYYHQAEVTDSTGITKIVCEGTVTVYPNLTG